jgi:hypothetical protein
MRYKKAMFMVSMMSAVFSTTHSAPGFSPGKQRIPLKMHLVRVAVLAEYTDAFLEQNPAINANISHSSDDQLRNWASHLAYQIEKRYLFSPSIIINRIAYHAKGIFNRLELARKQAQSAALAHPIHLDLQEFSPKSLRALLQENRLHQKECSEKMNALQDLIIQYNDGAEKDDYGIEAALLQMVDQLNGQYESILKSFVGIPHMMTRKKLNDRFKVLRQDWGSLQNYLPALLHHGQLLHTLNQSMHEKIESIFSDAHLGMTPYANKAMGLKWEMMRKAIDELADIHSQLSEKDAVIVDQLCKKTAVMLWGHWLNDLQMQSKRVPAQRNAVLGLMNRLKNHLVLLVSQPLCGLDHFQALLDPHHSGLVLSKKFLDQSCDHLLRVLEQAQNLAQASSQRAVQSVQPAPTDHGPMTTEATQTAAAKSAQPMQRVNA